MYAYVKYVYEAPKNGQTVVIAPLSYSIKACYWLSMAYLNLSMPWAKVLSRDRAIFFPLHIIYLLNFVYSTIWYKEKHIAHLFQDRHNSIITVFELRTS